jgi:hypothetical protein
MKPVYTNIRPAGNDLSPLSLSCWRYLAGTDKLCYLAVRHMEQLFQRFEQLLAEGLSHRTTAPSVTRAELYHWAARQALLLGGSTYGATRPVICRATLSSGNFLVGHLSHH